VSAEAGKAAWRTRLLAARAAITSAQLAAAARDVMAHVLIHLTDAARIAAYVPIGTEPGSLELLDVLRERGTVVLLPIVRPNRELDWATYRGAAALTAGRWGLREPICELAGPAPDDAGEVGDRAGPAGDDPGPLGGQSGRPVGDRVSPAGKGVGPAGSAVGPDGGGVGPAGGGVGPAGDRVSPVGDRAGSSQLERVDAILVPALAVDQGGTRLGRGAGYYDRALAGLRRPVPVVALLHDGELLPRLPADSWDRPVTVAVTPRDGWTNLPLVPHHRG
jgi:5-formyltetrahydrofolate cyclo-ligase